MGGLQSDPFDMLFNASIPDSLCRLMVPVVLYEEGVKEGGIDEYETGHAEILLCFIGKRLVHYPGERIDKGMCHFQLRFNIR